MSASSTVGKRKSNFLFVIDEPSQLLLKHMAALIATRPREMKRMINLLQIVSEIRTIKSIIDRRKVVHHLF